MNAPNAMVHGDLIRRMVQLRSDALERVRGALGHLEQARGLMDDAAQLRSAATADLCGASSHDYKIFGSLFGLPSSDTLESARRVIDAGCWSNLIEQCGFFKLMDAQARAEFAASLEGETPPFELEHVEATVRALLTDSRATYLRGVANAFAGLDRRFKSHDAFKFGRRIIFAGVFSEWGYIRWDHPVLEALADVCRIFALMDGDDIPEHSMVRDWLTEGRDGFRVCQTTVDTPYFRLKTFKNGNAHLWLTRRDLVEKVNLCLAEFYGEVLPDAVPKGERPVSTALAKDLQFYATPADVAAEALRWVRRAPQRILEPSAGEGALLEAIRDKFDGWHTDWRCTAIEVHEGRARTAAARTALDNRFSVRLGNFLSIAPPAESQLYDAVVMNPPFSGTHWMHHVRHALDFLGEGGELVAILPATAEIGTSRRHEEFRAMLEASVSSFHWRELPVGAFKSSGTNVSTVVLVVVK